MIIFKNSKSLSQHIVAAKKEGKTIVFIPTMGALHMGHLSLLDSAEVLNSLKIVSIFINPTQFNDAKDFDKYPITIEKDIIALEKYGADVLFLPSVNEMYPNGLKKNHQYNLGYLETVLEASFRRGHYQGVCQIVARLLEIIEPDVMVLGQKDFQQCLVIKRLVNLMGVPISIIISKTVREKDGLAMSSRNLRMSLIERNKAPLIYKVLKDIKSNLKQSFTHIKNDAVTKLTNEGFKVDYVEIANAETLEIINNWDSNTKVVILIAAYINEIRLIDNLIV